MIRKSEVGESIQVKDEAETLFSDDLIVWSKFKSGDNKAYQYIYNTYAPLLFRYGRKIVRNREIVKDCIHDLFVILWKNRETLGTPPSIRNYLFKSLRGKLFRASKNKNNAFYNNSFEEYDQEVVSSREFDIIHDEMAIDQKNVIVKALNTLTIRQREIIHLLFYNNFTADEVADTLSITKRTVYNTVYSALQSIKKNIPFDKKIFVVALAILVSLSIYFS